MAAEFNNDMYIRTQSEYIGERIQSFWKLYFEFGGGRVNNYHASRILPEFVPDSNIRMLIEFDSQAEAIVVINAEGIVWNEVLKDIDVDYDQ